MVENRTPDSRDEVRIAYDRIAERFDETRAAGESGWPFVERLVALARTNCSGSLRVLDAGCGAGRPVLQRLAERGCAVTGIDASAKMCELARRHVPSARILCADMLEVDLGETFDAVIAWDSLFHVPRERHAEAYARFAGWLKPGGGLLLSLGGREGDIRGEMFGASFFYNALAPEAARVLLEGAGFAIAHWELDDLTGGGHLAVLARRT
ncbi:MAG: class I SAM-dependent methyltransferase [Planctomycetes bacterium]|nr:class I SAM-dependent methyltransferase [Planctomycetota bacterium]